MHYTYYDPQQGQWRPVPGRAYLISMALLPQAMHNHTFVAHKDPAGAGWVVAHEETSAVVGCGRTRAAAVRDAQAALLAAGPDALESALQRVRRRVGSRP